MAEGLAERRRRPGSRSEQDRRARETVRETREKLINGSELKPEFEYELILMFVRNELAAQATLLLVAAIFAFASMFWAPRAQAIIWLILVIAAKVLLLEACKRFQALPREEVQVATWRRRFVLIELVNGVMWGGFALVGVSAAGAGFGPAGTGIDQPFTAQIFLFASLIVVLAVRMTFASTVIPILYVGTLPMTLAVVARLVAVQDAFHLALAAMALGVHVYFMFLAKGLYSTALTMLEYRATKDVLIAELEEQRAISDAARRRAEDANVAKSRFLATMSHELRTPLSSIIGFAELLHRELLIKAREPKHADYCRIIHESGEHLLSLVKDLLDVAKIESGKYSIIAEPVPVAEIVRSAVEAMRPAAEAADVVIRRDVAAGLPDLMADRRSVKQILLNLVSNACKFSDAGGEVTIRAEARGARIALIVADTGIGISQEHIGRIGQPFYQIESPLARRVDGAGLGLSIVRGLVALHGGELSVTSKVGEGTEFTVLLPADVSAEAGDADDAQARQATTARPVATGASAGRHEFRLVAAPEAR